MDGGLRLLLSGEIVSRQLLTIRHPGAGRGPSKCAEKTMDTGLRRYDIDTFSTI
jgi:hypothetical protein